MLKKDLLTFSGIVLSIAIALAGWTLADTLIERRSTTLLSETGIEQIIASPIAEPANEEANASSMPDDGRLYLSPSEIAEILRIWELPGFEHMHEPYANQISMEQAINEAMSGLAFFDDRGFPLTTILAERFRTTAYLCQYVTDQADESTFAPGYSYWNVEFTTDDAYVSLRLHAVTGQIWSIYVKQPYEPQLAAAWQRDGARKGLGLYLSYLHFDYYAEMYDEFFGLGSPYAYMGLDGGSLYATVFSPGLLEEISPRVVDFSMYLSSFQPFDVYREETAAMVEPLPDPQPAERQRR